MTENLIQFEPLEDAPIHGEASGSLPPLLGRAGDAVSDAGFGTLPALLGSSEGAIAHKGEAAGDLPSLLGRTGSAVSDIGAGILPALRGYSTNIAVDLLLNIGYGALPALLGDARGRIHHIGQGDAALPSLLGRTGDASGDAGFGVLPALIGTSYDPFPPAVRYITALQSPGVMLVTLGGATNIQSLTDGLNLHLEDFPQPVTAIFDGVLVNEERGVSLESILRLSEDVTFGDFIVAVLQVLLQDSVQVNDTLTPTAAIIAALQEALRLVEGPGATAEVQAAIATALALNELPSPAYGEALAETVGLDDATTLRINALLLLLDSVIVNDVPANTLEIGVILEETVALNDALAITLEVIQRLRDNIELSITIRIGDTTYLAWVVNTESQAFSTYEQYPFNSYTYFNGYYYGMADDGLYRLAGDTDEGEPINARVRTGLSNLGTGKLKRYPSLYLAYRSNGELLLKAVMVESTGEDEGEKVEYWYRLTPRPAGEVREGRIKLGRGLKSVFSAWEISNVDGSDFDLSELRLLPMVLDRRIT